MNITVLVLATIVKGDIALLMAAVVPAIGIKTVVPLLTVPGAIIVQGVICAEKELFTIGVVRETPVITILAPGVSL